MKELLIKLGSITKLVTLMKQTSKPVSASGADGCNKNSSTLIVLLLFVLLMSKMDMSAWENFSLSVLILAFALLVVRV
jgi:hypothetical protein